MKHLRSGSWTTVLFGMPTEHTERLTHTQALCSAETKNLALGLTGPRVMTTERVRRALLVIG